MLPKKDPQHGAMKSGVQTGLRLRWRATNVAARTRVPLICARRDGPQCQPPRTTCRSCTPTKQVAQKLNGMVTLPKLQSTKKAKTCRHSIPCLPLASTAATSVSRECSSTSTTAQSTPLTANVRILKCILFILPTKLLGM